MATRTHHQQGMLAYEVLEAGDGPTIGFSARIHGNERCGEIALAALLQEYGENLITRGRMIMIPQLNPMAVATGGRTGSSGRDMNRHVARSAHPQTEEEFLGNAIHDVLARFAPAQAGVTARTEPKSDRPHVWIDLHSVHEETAYPDAFARISDPDMADPARRRFALNFGAKFCKTLLCGWGAAYRRSFEQAGRADLTARPVATMNEAAAQHGFITFTRECGQHDDPQSIATARRTILIALHEMGMLPAWIAQQEQLQPNAPEAVSVLEAQEVVFYQPGARLPEGMRDGEDVAAGAPLILHADGSVRRAAEQNVVVMMPNHNPAEPSANRPLVEHLFLAVRRPLAQVLAAA